MEQRIWFERSFTLDTPAAAMPELIERLRGTPARVEERVQGVEPYVLNCRVEGRWSIQEQVGHLADLEPLWLGRVEDILSGRSRLREADLENTATWEAGHNDRSISSVLGAYRQRRAELIAALEPLGPGDVEATALHPRLEQPMTIADLGFFVAEHDDHHLATISALIRAREVTS